jgi:adenine phosphoribosyltransferase
LEEQVTQAVSDIKQIIRDIPNFPKQGIIFKDITPLLGNGELFQKAVNIIAEQYQNAGIQKIVCMESRGFILGAPIAYRLGAGMVPIRKKGKLPYKTISATYKLEYGTDTLEMHEDAIKANEKTLIIDDVLATGGTAGAAVELVKKAGANIVGIAFLIELLFLEGRKNLKDYTVYSLIQY